MTNLEFYKDELKEMIDEEIYMQHITKIANAFSKFINKHSNDINFTDTSSTFIDWLLAEHKEPIKLTLHEKCILESLPNDYKYIARDQNGDLFIYKQEPIRECDTWHLPNQFAELRSINIFKDLFKFIKPEDELPYMIEDILKNCEVVENER